MITVALSLWLASAIVVGVAVIRLVRADDTPEVTLSPDDRIDLWLMDSDDPTWVDRVVGS